MLQLCRLCVFWLHERGLVNIRIDTAGQAASWLWDMNIPGKLSFFFCHSIFVTAITLSFMPSDPWHGHPMSFYRTPITSGFTWTAIHGERSARSSLNSLPSPCHWGTVFHGQDDALGSLIFSIAFTTISPSLFISWLIITSYQRSTAE